jgi:hypothetical protein
MIRIVIITEPGVIGGDVRMGPAENPNFGGPILKPFNCCAASAALAAATCISKELAVVLKPEPEAVPPGRPTQRY